MRKGLEKRLRKNEFEKRIADRVTYVPSDEGNGLEFNLLVRETKKAAKFINYAELCPTEVCTATRKAYPGCCATCHDNLGWLNDEIVASDPKVYAAAFRVDDGFYNKNKCRLPVFMRSFNCLTLTCNTNSLIKWYADMLDLVCRVPISLPGGVRKIVTDDDVLALYLLLVSNHIMICPDKPFKTLFQHILKWIRGKEYARVKPKNYLKRTIPGVMAKLRQEGRRNKDVIFGRA